MRISRSTSLVPALAATAFTLCATAALSAAPPQFKVQRIGTYRSEACGVGDFNNDGKLDIVAGPYWYEAPHWKPHQFRELRGEVDEQGKGYRDDFMNIPLDVDRDGRLDVVTCCWFAKRIEWYRNTGDQTPWPMIALEPTGNHETGEAWDIDGDGKANEILPDTRDTHWYEVGEVDGKTGLVKHVVSSKKSPFGGGCGDVNGDGRPDIIRPDVWYEAPEDARNGEWKAHPLALGTLGNMKPNHTPQIWVLDVNADGKNDIITSAAHQHGLFWYEQIVADGEIAWKQHVIDQSWSQVHSITLADLDGDGDADLVTGKRFYAHNGNDPGANDPLVVYWYEFNPGSENPWKRHTLSQGEGIGAGLNIPVVDLDNDGDLDIIVTGKWGGPVIFENQTK